MKTKSVIKKLKDERWDLANMSDSLEHVLEITLADYIEILKIVKMKGFSAVYDIGCSTGYQAELFVQNGIDYKGIERNKEEHYFTKKENIWSTYFNLDYPQERISLNYFLKEKSVAISNLCIGWGVYKIHKDEYDRQFKALSEDFRACILHMQLEREELLKKYFKKVKKYKVEKGEDISTAYFYCEGGKNGIHGKL